MHIDIERLWNIKPERTRELTVPGSQSRKYVINEEYLLKEEDCITAENLAAATLAGIKTPHVIGRPHLEAGRIYTLFHLHRQVEELSEEILEKAGMQAAAISKAALRGLAKRDSLSLLESGKDIIRKHASERTLSVYENAIMHLEGKLFPFLKFFNYVPCHGDFHPGNLLIEGEEVLVSDWETLCMGEELSDIAMMLGCIGINDPTDILKDKAKALLDGYGKKGRPTRLAFSLLPELVLASRLQWLHKWLVLNNDQEIIWMETELLSMLQENAEKLREKWMASFVRSTDRYVIQDAEQLSEVKQALERLQGKRGSDEELATDLRLSMIWHGQNEDILSVLRTLNRIEDLARHSKSIHVLIEYSIALGNSSLDLSRSGLLQALQGHRRLLSSIVESHPDRPELLTGYILCLRNLSIALAEDGELDNALEQVKELGRIAEGNEEHLGEFARALSNAITSLLKAGRKHDSELRALEGLNRQYPDNRKIKVAYQLAQKNISLLPGRN
jgi:thiamine kinase-like enzyme